MSEFFSASGNYLWASLSGAVLVLTVLLLAWVFLCSLAGGFDSSKKVWPLVPLAICVVLATPATTLLLAAVRITPPAAGQGADFHPEESDQQAALIKSEANHLQRFLKDPRSLTLAEIEEGLRQSIDLSQRIDVLLKERKALMAQLREAEQKEQAKAAQASRLREMTRGQVEAVREIITQEAREETSKAFWKDVALSFLSGVLTSILGSWMFRRWFGPTYANTIGRSVERTMQN